MARGRGSCGSRGRGASVGRGVRGGLGGLGLARGVRCHLRADRVGAEPCRCLRTAWACKGNPHVGTGPGEPEKSWCQWAQGRRVSEPAEG